MQSKKVKTLIMQWVLPTIILVALLVGVLTDYRSRNVKVVNSFVESSIEQTGGTYSRNISATLNAMTGVTDVIDEMMEDRADGNIYHLVESLDAIKSSGAAFSVVYCYSDGIAVATGYENASLKSTDYYDKLQGTDSFFAYTEDDGFTGQPAIIYVSPVEFHEEVQGYLIAFLNPKELTQLFQDGNSYGEEVFYAIVNQQGSILASFGGVNTTGLLENDFWSAIKQGTEMEGSWNVFDRLRQNRQFGKIKITKGEEQRILCQFPIENTDWCLVMGLQQEYADRMLEKVWNPMVWLLVKIGIFLIGYLTIVVVINVMTRIRNSEQKRELEAKADTDLLTELSNKIATERQIREYMAENPDKQAVMFVLDVDNFKKINDTLGHAFGDEVLRNLGMRLRSMFRVTDIIGRIGGDEFIIFLKDVREDAVIEREGRKIETFFRNFEVGEYVKYSVTASVGGAVFPRDADNFEDLYKAADRAVYSSKKHGKNQLSFYRQENQSEAGKEESQSGNENNGSQE